MRNRLTQMKRKILVLWKGCNVKQHGSAHRIIIDMPVLRIKSHARNEKAVQIKGAVTLCNFSCNFSRNTIARQVARKIAQYNSALSLMYKLTRGLIDIYYWFDNLTVFTDQIHVNAMKH